MEFKTTYLAGIILDSDLKKTILAKKNGKLLAYTTSRNPTEVSDQVWLSKYIFQNTDYQVEPDCWRLIISIKRIDLESETKIYAAYTQFKFAEDSRYRIVNINKLDNTISPLYKWVLPMSCDPSVVTSEYNQILIR